MPLYQYYCEEHGPFEAFASMQDRHKAMRCPDCLIESNRMITVPRLSGLGSLRMQAEARNEKSRHEPHVCKTSTCCGRGHSHKKERKKGLQSYTGSRPWVIEHK
ncbi:MAG: FmdB family zinc ribbon protein [Verrucomicrobiota bacterium]